MVTSEKESDHAREKRRKEELEALSDDELRTEIEEASPEKRRAAMKMAVGWLRAVR